jgi:hypothetical protein
VDNSVVTDLDECIRVLAAALGYPDGAPPPSPVRLTPVEVAEQRRRRGHARYCERVARYSDLRSRGYTTLQAGAALEICAATAYRYEAHLRAG